jgi:hypothetical protein
MSSYIFTNLTIRNISRETKISEHATSVRRGVDKSLAFPVCSTIKKIFLGWVKEVRTTKS